MKILFSALLLIAFNCQAGTTTMDSPNYLLHTDATGAVDAIISPAGKVSMLETEYYADATGTADALVATYPLATSTLIDGYRLTVGITGLNTTTTPTFAPVIGGAAQTARVIKKFVGNVEVALSASDLQGDADLRYDLPNLVWVLMNPASVNATTVTVGSGVTGLVMQPYTTSTFGAIYSTAVTPNTTNYAFVANASAVYVNGVTSTYMAVNALPVVSATSTGAAVTGALSVSGPSYETSKTVTSTASLTVTTVSTKYNYYTGVAGASFAITLPAAAAGINGMKIVIMSTAARATTTWISTGATFVGAPTSLTANFPVALQYDQTTAAWYITD
jgi:hypothetical protein